MPRRPRSQVIEESKVGIYHVRAKCVRGLFLCGKERDNAVDYNYRRRWIRARLIYLASAFAIDVLHYDILSNHLHLELRNRPDLVKLWSDKEVIRRACLIHAPKFAEKGVIGGVPTRRQLVQFAKDKKLVAEYRKRLSSISWLMRGLTQFVARKANIEEKKSGNFWNSRFHAAKILDETGVLLCALYIDLNQVRAGMALTPEESEFSSVHDRILGARARLNPITAATAHEHDGWLSPLSHSGDGQEGYPVKMRASSKGVVDMSLEEYLLLLDWTGRQLHPGKRGVINDSAPPILERIGFNREGWLNCMRDFKRLFKTTIGRGDSMRAYALRKRRRCVHGSDLVDQACRGESAG